jgi:hypothetical protein
LSFFGQLISAGFWIVPSGRLQVQSASQYEQVKSLSVWSTTVPFSPKMSVGHLGLAQPGAGVAVGETVDDLVVVVEVLVVVVLVVVVGDVVVDDVVVDDVVVEVEIVEVVVEVDVVVVEVEVGPVLVEVVVATLHSAGIATEST